MHHILVIGVSGQLASELKYLSSQYSQFSFFFKSSSETDIRDRLSLEKAIAEINPDFIINCAAYTAVDKAESDQVNAYDINKNGVKNLAELAKEYSAYLIHISTDFVFDGKNTKPYIESDPTSPLSIYGDSKLKGEIAIQNSGCDYSIIRTSWLYSSFGNNFVKTMMRLGAEKESLNVVSDQIGSPTYCRDLAKFILDNIEKFSSHKNNIYHFSNEGVASWYDFAVEIMRFNQLTCQVNPIPTTDYPTPATRPKYSVMDKSKIKSHFSVGIPEWKTSLAECILELKK